MIKSSAKVGLILGVALSAGLLVYVLSGLEWGQFFAQLTRIRPVTFLPLFLLYLLSSWIRAKRWQYLLPNGHSLSIRRLFNACVLGNLASYALPLRAGEFVRPWVLSRAQPVKFPAAFASIVTERVFDVITMLTLLGVCISQMADPPRLVSVGATMLGGVALVIGLLMITAYFAPAALLRGSAVVCSALFSRFPHLSEKIQLILKEFIDGLKVISTPKEFLLIFFWSFALWMEFATVYHVMMLSFGEHPSLWVSQVLNVIIALAIAAPSAPGFIGTFQFGCITALSGIYHYSQEFATAYSVFAHSLQVIFTTIVGIVILKDEGLRFRELAASPRSEALPEGSAE